MKADPVLLICAYIVLILELLLQAFPWFMGALFLLLILWLWCSRKP